MHKCCSLVFDDLHSYLKHLDFHNSNTDLQVKCNLCGHNSETWAGFKRHCLRDHLNSQLFNSLTIEEDIEYNNDQANLSNRFDNDSPYSKDSDSEQADFVNDPLIEAILNQSITFVFKMWLEFRNLEICSVD